MSFFGYIGDILTRRRTLAWVLAFVISAAPFLLLRYFMAWQQQSYFEAGLVSGVLIKELLPDSCYVCVAVGLAYWSDLFLSSRHFDAVNSARATTLSYLNVFLVFLMAFAGVLYFISSLVDKQIFKIAYDPSGLVRSAVVFLFLTIVVSTFIGEQILHELEVRHNEAQNLLRDVSVGQGSQRPS